MKKLLVASSLVFILMLSACQTLYIKEKQIRPLEVCVASHQEFSHFLWIGGKGGLIFPTVGAVPVAQYRTVCDEYGITDAFIIILSNDSERSVTEDVYNSYFVGNEY